MTTTDARAVRYASSSPHIDFAAFDDRALSVVECLAMMESLAQQWHGMFDVINAVQASHVGMSEPLPQWACEVLQQYSAGAYQQYIAFFIITRTSLQTMIGFQSDMVYEVWTHRGHRLDGQFMFIEHAKTALQTHRASFPDAFINCVNAGKPLLAGRDDSALLDTLIGEIRYLRMRPDPSHGDPLHAVQDITGRVVSVRADELRNHAVFGRMTAEGRAAVTMVSN